MSDEIDSWFAAGGDREQELRRVDELITAAAPGIDRQLVPELHPVRLARPGRHRRARRAGA
jgi:hypothetical protein